MTSFSQMSKRSVKVSYLALFVIVACACTYKSNMSIWVLGRRRRHQSQSHATRCCRTAPIQWLVAIIQYSWQLRWLPTNGWLVAIIQYSWRLRWLPTNGWLQSFNMNSKSVLQISRGPTTWKENTNLTNMSQWWNKTPRMRGASFRPTVQQPA